MRKLLFATVAVLAAISTASAADLPVYTKAPPPAPLFSWTGFYVGLNVGGKWARTDGHVDADGIDTIGLDRTTDSTVIGGGQIGYNWQAPGSPWVFGIEADADAQHWTTTRTLGGATVFFLPGDTFTVESHWQASVRGRIGYAAWDRTLIYVTGGVAFTQMKVGTALVSSAGLLGGFAATDDTTVVGGTVGVGFEYAFTNNISLGIEGRWTGYGTQDFDGGSPVVGGVATPLTHHVNLDTADVLGKLNFRF